MGAEVFFVMEQHDSTSITTDTLSPTKTNDPPEVKLMDGDVLRRNSIIGSLPN